MVCSVVLCDITQLECWQLTTPHVNIWQTYFTDALDGRQDIYKATL